MICARYLLRMLLAITVLMSPALAGSKVSSQTIYTGMCDASGGVALDKKHFAVANDEDSQIRIYRRDVGGDPVETVDLSGFLRLDVGNPETDLEAVARIGDRVFWLGSHGRSTSGRERSNRHRFFATDVERSPHGVGLRPVGAPYLTLVEDLIRQPQLEFCHLAEAAQLPSKAPNGLNIEGLAATPEKTLLIGFRNPLPKGQAALVPLLNPDDVVMGRPARYGQAILLDLDGQGIRDIAQSEGKYLIIGGSALGGGESRLYRWAGGTAKPKWLWNIHLEKLNPEAIIIYPDRGFGEVQILSDDGKRHVEGQRCKDLPEAAQRFFRSVWVRP